jgi:hypothetical protein
MTYGWYNISQCCGSEGGNSFEIKINSSGLVDTRIAGALINWSPVTSGMSGNLSQGQYYQYYHGQGLNIVPGSSNIFSWQALGGTGSDICVSNPLSSPSCPNYTEAQCNINPLYSPTCPGYTTAQCNINPLFSITCSGYQAAYYSQQCSLNPLYDSGCPGYAEAYAKKNLLADNTSSSATTSTSQPSPTINSDGSVSTSVSKTGDANVDKAISSPTTSTTAATAPAAPVQLAPSGGSNVGTQANTQTQNNQKTEAAASSSATQQRTERQQSARTESRSSNESKSNSEMKQAANAKAKEEMKKAETASSFEGQIAVQQNVIGAMSFVPGFDTYAQTNVPDVLARQLQRQYGKENVDNRRLGRGLFGASDRLHSEMVDSQYR